MLVLSPSSNNTLTPQNYHSFVSKSLANALVNRESTSVLSVQLATDSFNRGSHFVSYEVGTQGVRDGKTITLLLEVKERRFTGDERQGRASSLS